MGRVEIRNRSLVVQANDYENHLYGPDFYTPLQRIDHWIRSPSFFWSIAIRDDTENADVTRDHVLGAFSILVTTPASAAALIGGHIREYDLEVWKPEHGLGNSALYYCSFSVCAGDIGHSLYAAAATYFDKYYARHPIAPSFGFSIAAGSSGEAHLSKCGFVKTSVSYLGDYPIFRATCEAPLSPSWASLLRCGYRATQVIADHTVAPVK